MCVFIIYICILHTHIWAPACKLMIDHSGLPGRPVKELAGSDVLKIHELSSARMPMDLMDAYGW
jgi:hypothetical protein